MRAETKNIHTVDVNKSTTLPRQCCLNNKLSALFELHYTRQTYSHYHPEIGFNQFENRKILNSATF